MKKILFIIITTICLIAILTAGIIYYKIHTGLLVKDTNITINTNETTLNILSKICLSNDLSKLDTYFLGELAEIKKLKKVKSGYYIFQKGMSANTIINTLRSGNQSPIKITFNNTRTLAEFAGKIARQIEPDSLDLLQHFLNDSVVKSYGFSTPNAFIGMFIPNTYQVYYSFTPKEFTDRMFKEYNDFWNKERKNRAKEIGYTPQEISILASIVEEETNKDDEKSRIAGVYINRLKKGMLLQADPTLKFAVYDFTIKRILNKHKEVDSPYNTYKYAGLPPAPIRQPSIKGLESVLNYERHNYFYFCAKANFSGYHNFAKTLTVHNRNAKRYQQALNRQKIK